MLIRRKLFPLKVLNRDDEDLLVKYLYVKLFTQLSNIFVCKIVLKGTTISCIHHLFCIWGVIMIKSWSTTAAFQAFCVRNSKDSCTGSRLPARRSPAPRTFRRYSRPSARRRWRSTLARNLEKRTFGLLLSIRYARRSFIFWSSVKILFKLILKLINLG